MPSSASRIHTQKAGAILCSPKKTTIDDRIIMKLKIIDNGNFSQSSKFSKIASIFPYPSSDPFYRCLCNIPYYTHRDHTFDYGHPLLGLFPIYADSVTQLVKEYLPLTKILSPRPSSHWNIATGIARVGEKIIKVRAATHIILSALMIQSIKNEQNNKRLDMNSWKSTNLLIEFQPEASLITPSLKLQIEVVRGLWVVIGKKHLRIANLIDTFHDNKISHACLYSLPEFNLIQKSCDCSNHDYELDIFKKATALLTNNTLAVSKIDNLNYLIPVEAHP
jgi:hypothetical protein